MNAPPLISVIIPIYNSEKYLKQAIESAQQQTYKNIEIIAVNDGSTDQSQKILNQYINQPKIKIINQTNQGASAARNHGVRESSGELLAFLDSDDIWDNNKLEKQYNILKEHPNAVGIYSDVRYINAEGETIKPTDAYRMAWCSGDITEPLIMGRGVFGFSPSLALIRTKYFNIVGGFPEAAKQYEDYGLWLKLSLQGPFLYLVETLSSYRRHTTSLTASNRVHEEQLHGQYLALLSCKQQIMNHDKASIRDAYRKEYFHCSKKIGWWARRWGDTELSIQAYCQALSIKHFDLHCLTRLLVVFFTQKITKTILFLKTI